MESTVSLTKTQDRTISFYLKSKYWGLSNIILINDKLKAKNSQATLNPKALIL